MKYRYRDQGPSPAVQFAVSFTSPLHSRRSSNHGLGGGGGSSKGIDAIPFRPQHTVVLSELGPAERELYFDIMWNALTAAAAAETQPTTRIVAPGHDEGEPPDVALDLAGVLRRVAASGTAAGRRAAAPDGHGRTDATAAAEDEHGSLRPGRRRDAGGAFDYDPRFATRSERDRDAQARCCRG